MHWRKLVTLSAVGIDSSTSMSTLLFSAAVQYLSPWDAPSNPRRHSDAQTHHHLSTNVAHLFRTLNWCIPKTIVLSRTPPYSNAREQGPSKIPLGLESLQLLERFHSTLHYCKTVTWSCSSLKSKISSINVFYSSPPFNHQIVVLLQSAFDPKPGTLIVIVHCNSMSSLKFHPLAETSKPFFKFVIKRKKSVLSPSI